jgi:hypothetical protein
MGRRLKTERSKVESARLNSLLTLAANVGVIVSLLFLAYEINQSTQATIASASQGLTDQSLEYFGMLIDEDAVPRAVFKQREGEELTDYESLQLDLVQQLNFRVFENAFLQYRRGFFEESEWERYRRIIRGRINDDRRAQQMWERTAGGWTKEFIAEVESLKSD